MPRKKEFGSFLHVPVSDEMKAAVMRRSSLDGVKMAETVRMALGAYLLIQPEND